MTNLVAGTTGAPMKAHFAHPDGTIDEGHVPDPAPLTIDCTAERDDAASAYWELLEVMRLRDAAGAFECVALYELRRED